MANHRSKLTGSSAEKRSNSVLADFIDVAVIYMRVLGTDAALEMMDVNGVPRRISERVIAQVFRRQWVR